MTLVFGGIAGKRLRSEKRELEHGQLGFVSGES